MANANIQSISTDSSDGILFHNIPIDGLPGFNFLPHII